MPLNFELLTADSLPIELDGLLPENVAGKSLAQISRLLVVVGNRQVALGELFRVSGHLCSTTDNPPELHFTGDLSHLHGLGANLSSGRIVVRGNIGLNAGRQMSGGELLIEGSAGDNLGLAMRGGLIRAEGNVGHGIGAALPGASRGMRGGVILVHGSAGDEVGRRMRRGLIAIGGACGALAGCEMLAGTIVIAGDCGPHVGYDMRRGTIAVLGAGIQPGVTFRPGYRHQPTFLRLVATQLARLGWPPAAEMQQAHYRAFHGDLLHSGRGELLLAG